MKKYIFYILLLSVLLSCDRKNKNEYVTEESNIIRSNVEKIAIEGKYKNILQYDSIFKSVNIIPLETTSNCLIQNISKIKIYKSLIYIQNDKNNILVFNMNGKLVRSIGTKGRGPGEIKSLRDFDIDRDNVYILDFQSIKRFNLKGDFEKNYNMNFFTPKDVITCNPLQFAVKENMFYIWGGTLSVKNNENENLFALYTLDKDLSIKHRYFPLNHKLSNLYNRFRKYSGSILLTPPLGNDNIYEISNDTVKIKYEIDFKNRKLNVDFPNNLQTLSEWMLKIDSKYAHSIENVCEVDDWLYFRFKHNKKVYNVYFNKNAKSTYVSSFYPRPDNKFSPFKIDATYDDKFIALIPSRIFLEDGKNMDPSIRKKYITDKQFNQIDEVDNPVLYICEMLK